MRLGIAGETLIKGFEKLSLRAYDDGYGYITIGWGHTGRGGGMKPKLGDTITAAQAQEIFHEDIQRFVNGVNRLVRVPLTQNQFDAIVSFHFNTGALGGSGVLRAINERRYDDVPAELAKWNRVTVGGRKVTSRGLVRRRAAEISLWSAGGQLEGHEQADAAAQSGPQVARKTGKPMRKSKIGAASVVSGTLASGGAYDIAKTAMKAVGDASDQVDSVKDARDDVTNIVTFMGNMGSTLLHDPVFLSFAGILVLSAAVFYWRWRMVQDEDY